MVPSSAMVPDPAAIVAPSPNGAGSLASVPSHGPRVYEVVVPLAESLEPAPGWTRENSLRRRAFDPKRSGL